MIGKILGNRYEILEKIGEGGMAKVYKAKDKLLNRFVAIKILKDEFTEDEDFVRKFRRESQSAASLSHPNILYIYDVGVEEEDNKKIYYIVMEYINGKTLKEVIREKNKLSADEAIYYSLQIAEALENAHKNHIVHRDIKPHNIMITEDNRVKVTDFGIARAVTSSTVTTTSNVLGSVHYFSPEQARGGYTDEKSDIYSLGIVMYEMVTGKVPYEGDSPISVALKHVQDDIIPPRDIDATIPLNLESVILKCVQKKQSDRYNNTTELINDLKNIRLLGKDVHVERVNDMSSATRVMPAVESDIKGDNKMNKSKNKKTKKKGKKSDGGIKVIFAAILLAFLLVTSIFFGFFKFKSFLKSDEIPVPNLVGMDQKVAEKTLNDLGLNMKVLDKVKDSKYKVGEVVHQDVDADLKVKEGYTIGVTINEGEELAFVPLVMNKPLTDAEALIEDAGLQVGKRDVETSDTVPKNSVIRQYPDAMTEVAVDSKVDLVISEGPEIKEVIMKKLVGKSIDEAQKIITDDDLVVGEVNTQPSNKIPADIVIWQEYNQGTVLETKTSVDLIISSGPSTDQPGDQPTEPGTESGMGSITIVLPPRMDKEETNIKINKRIDGTTEVVFSGTIKASDEPLVRTFTGKIGTEFDIMYDDVYQSTKTITKDSQ